MKIDYEVIDKILQDVDLYEDWYDSSIVYAEFTKLNGQPWFCSMDGETFKGYLRLMYCKLADTDDELTVAPVLRRLHDILRQNDEHERVKVCYRVAGNLSAGMEYFLADNKRQVVQVDAHGIKTTSKKKHKFINRAGTLQQVAPLRGESDIFTLLQPYVNLSGDNFKLFVIWLIQAFCDQTHYSLFISAERGSGKSVLTYIIGELLDPSPSVKCLMPTSLDDLETLLSNQYLCSFDNVSTISKDYSDRFCVAVTGGTISRRKKFFDSDMVYLPVNNVIVLNGIDIAPSESDLAERSLFLALKKLRSNELKSQAQLEKAFTSDKPYILHEVFSTLSKAMKIYPQLMPKNPPRMVDAYTEMLAIALALGIKEADFAKMITENTAAMDKARGSEPLIEAVTEAMDSHGKRKLEGTSTEVFKMVRHSFSGKPSLLPPTAATFAKKLSQLEAPLREAGFRILLDDTGAKSNRITIIRKKENA